MAAKVKHSEDLLNRHLLCVDDIAFANCGDSL